jgi:hypothetical protein
MPPHVPSVGQVSLCRLLVGLSCALRGRLADYLTLRTTSHLLRSPFFSRPSSFRPAPAPLSLSQCLNRWSSPFRRTFPIFCRLNRW